LGIVHRSSPFLAKLHLFFGYYPTATGGSDKAASATNSKQINKKLLIALSLPAWGWSFSRPVIDNKLCHAD
jgi:hypothetical protein